MPTSVSYVPESNCSLTSPAAGEVKKEDTEAVKLKEVAIAKLGEDMASRGATDGKLLMRLER